MSKKKATKKQDVHSELKAACDDIVRQLYAEVDSVEAARLAKVDAEFESVREAITELSTRVSSLERRRLGPIRRLLRRIFRGPRR